MANKVKRKRRLRKTLKLRHKDVIALERQREKELLDKCFIQIFVKAGVLSGKR